MRLSCKVVLVTGGGTGIGAATARRFAAARARLVLLGPQVEPLDSAARGIASVNVGTVALA